MEHAIGQRRQLPPRDVERHRAGIDAVQASCAWRDQAGPPPRTASRIEAHRVCGQRVPGEAREVQVEDTADFVAVDGIVVEPRPLVTERRDGAGVLVDQVARLVGRPWGS